jgi:hypothetical protein
MTSDEQSLLERIAVNPKIFGGKPIIRGRRLAVEHVLGMLAAGDTPETILAGSNPTTSARASCTHVAWSATNASNHWLSIPVHEAAPRHVRLGQRS